MSIYRERFGRFGQREIYRYILDNGRMKACISDFGGLLTGLHVPDASGRQADVVLGFDRLEDYLAGHYYFGAIVGRCANRIAGGRFELDGRGYQLSQNESNGGHLHGGVNGFDRQVWEAFPEQEEWVDRLVLRLVSPHLDEGYPGELQVRAVYSLNQKSELSLEFEAETDRPTIVNLAGHSYFNLAGHAQGSIDDHALTIKAEAITPVGEDLIPWGPIQSVAGGPYDFRRPRLLGPARAEVPEGGFDLNYVLTGQKGRMKEAAVLRDPFSGRKMTVYTTAAGLQLYTGQHIPEGMAGKAGAIYGPMAGLCLETQDFPNAVNVPSFPSVVLRPGEVYRHTVIYAFGW